MGARILILMAATQPSGIDDEVTAYLTDAAPEGRAGYERIRAIVRAQAGTDRVSERLSYKMPTFFVDGRVLLHVGLWEEHLAVYPVPDSGADPALADDLAAHRKGKGTLHFPHAQTWPAALIERLVSAHLERFER